MVISILFITLIMNNHIKTIITMLVLVVIVLALIYLPDIIWWISVILVSSVLLTAIYGFIYEFFESTDK